MDEESGHLGLRFTEIHSGKETNEGFEYEMADWLGCVNGDLKEVPPRQDRPLGLSVCIY